MEPLYVSMKKATEISDLSRSSLYRLANAKIIKTKKVRGRRLVEVESLRALPEEA